jgi:chromosome partitioning protein
MIKTEFQNLFLLPSDINLAGAELEIADFPHRESILKNAVVPIKADFDYIIIDCPPSLGIITTNALTLADTILVPIQCEYYALEGLSQLILTMYDGRLNLTQQVVAEVKKFFPKKVFSTVVPRGVRLSEAPSFGMPCYYFDKRCKGTESYLALATEIIRKEK